MFNQLGLQPVEQHLPGCTTVLFGYYNCSSPPEIGFQLGDSNLIFEFEPSASQEANDGHNNCTSIVTGIDFGSPDFWIIGQAWMHVDFNAVGGNHRVGIAQLKGDTISTPADPTGTMTAVSGAERLGSWFGFL